jgi:hypothetical protein
MVTLKTLLERHPEWADLPIVVYCPDGHYDWVGDSSKFFHPASAYTAYVLEGEQHEDGDWEFFGLVKFLETELGYFTLHELESVRVFGLGIERDRYFGEHTLAEVEAGKVS